MGESQHANNPSSSSSAAQKNGERKATEVAGESPKWPALPPRASDAGDGQAPSPKREVCFFPARKGHSWRWKQAIKTDCLTQQ